MLGGRKQPREGTQKAIVLEMLILANGEEIEGFNLAANAHSMAVHSVISTLRIDYGWDIRNRREYVKHEGHSICYSYYSLNAGQSELDRN